MDFWNHRSRQDRVVVLALIFLACLASADAGHTLHTATAPALIWPAAGVALASALLVGNAALLPIGLAELVFVFFVNHNSLGIALALAAANMLQVFLAVYALRKLGFRPGFSRLSDAFVLILVSIVAAAIVPSLGAALFFAAGLFGGSAVGPIWGSWYVGQLASFLVLTPFLVRWLPRFPLSRTKNEWIEIGLSVGLVFAISVLLFWTPFAVVNGVPLVYLLLMPFIWVGLRMGPRIMTATMLLATATALTGTLVNAPTSILGNTLFSVELLFSILAIIFLLLAALAEERKEATIALRKQLLRLEDALEKIRGEDQAKSDFLAVLAHELRNPLAPLLSSLELLRLTETSREMRETVNAMRGRVRTMARLLDDLLDVSRITRGKLTLNKEPVDLCRIVERAIETTKPEMEKRRHTFESTLPGTPLRTMADPVRMEQVVVNLLNNAAKYTEDGGRIRLSLRAAGKEAVLSVKDSGVGIVPGMIQRVFEPFRQGEPAKRMSQGLGIGLALSKNLVELHGGRIEAKSEGPGKGSEFILHFPLVKAGKAGSQGGDEHSREMKKIRPAKSPLTILIVDDNRAAADALAALLQRINHEASTAYDGASGIERTATLKPDAVILDIGLPDMEGYEVARRLRESGSRATLIALTGYGQGEDKQKALVAGFDHHLTKPVGLVDLEALLRTIHPAPRK